MKAQLTVRYVTGREEHFEAEVQAGGTQAKWRVQEFLKGQTLSVQTEDEVIVIPAGGVESVSFTMPPEAMAALDLPDVIQASRVQ